MTGTASAGGDAPRLDSAGGGLVLDDVRVDYGAARALNGLSLRVPAGAGFAILGVNGAGKSTFGRAASGLVPVSSGRIYFDGTDITGWSTRRISRLGLRYIPEGRGVLTGLSVADNLQQASLTLPRRERKRAITEMYELFPVLGQRHDQRSGSMSGGEQQMLAMALALVARPKLVIADEMSLGLAPKMVSVVLETLELAKDRGITVILIEQFIHRALAFADSCAILDRGRVTWSGTAAEAGPGVLHAYLGETSSA
jgi:branched-chain amino acid transport system ATP-binding protein